MTNGERRLIAYPQKRPLIELTSRPVQLETPFDVFNGDVFTPNDAFYVRWHLAGMPTSVDAAAYRLKIGGLVNTPLELSLDDLRHGFEETTITAVSECSGNSRGFMNPRVAGGQWANGAMGNAIWRGVRLRDVLAKAGLKAGAVQVSFRGLDEAPWPQTPKFAKAIDIDLARDPNVLLAYAMNNQALPLLNGFPVRLVVPGYYATYWVKMLDRIDVLDHPEDSFWMKTAYRIPAVNGGCVTPQTTGFSTVPIGKLTVRSFITSLQNGDKLDAGRSLTVRGIAFDGGSGIQSVQFSTDGGTTRSYAKLGPDYGRFSFREWTATFTPQSGTAYTLVPTATAKSGETQRATCWNASGYLLNSPWPVKVSA